MNLDLQENGIYFGRFQPFHIEHLRRVGEIRQSYPNVRLNIGLADWQGERTKSNFLYTPEALMIARLSLHDAGYDEVEVFGVPLGAEIDLRSSISDFINEHNIKYVYSGSDRTLKVSRELAGDSGKIIIVDLEEKGIRATDIRRSIREGTGSWKDSLTLSAAEYVNEMLPQLNHRLVFLPEGQKRPWVDGELITYPGHERK